VSVDIAEPAASAAPMVLEYGEGPQRVAGIVTVEQLDKELDRITAEAESSARPYMVNLISAGGRVLGVGLGADYSVASWIDEDSEHPYLLSGGNLDVARPLEFFYGNQWSEFPPSGAIDVESARAAMREFLRTDALPRALKWTE
jgi:hypothetical protein